MGYITNPHGQAEASKRWYNKKKLDPNWMEYRRQQQRKNRNKNLEQYRATARKNYKEKYRKFVGVCPICGFKGKLVWDHNHNTGVFRAWICRPCNGVLGLAKDNSDILNNCIKYLRDHGGS